MRVQPIALFFRLVMRSRHLFRRRLCRDSHGLSVGLRGSTPRAGAVGLVFLMSLVGLSGCHISWPFDRPASSLDNAQFMEAWKTYLHCRSSVELEEIQADLQQLNSVAHAVSPRNHASVRLFPAPVRTLIAMLPSRLAVDPQAMSAACALHGSQVAQTAGQPELSVEWLTEVAAHEGWASSHYAVQAGHQLKRME